ncbi:hypothetical protein Tco_1322336, partial [Tanacetum coccineum]
MKVIKNPVQPELAAGGVAFSQIRPFWTRQHILVRSGYIDRFSRMHDEDLKETGAAILIAFFMSAVFHEVAGKALFMAHVEGQLK